MSHMRTLVVIGSVVLSLGLFCVGWVLNSSWEVENISLRSLPDVLTGERDKNLDAPPPFSLQPASVQPFPDQPRDKVKRQPELPEADEAAAHVTESVPPPPSSCPQPAAVDPFPEQLREKFVYQPEPRKPSRCELKLSEPRVALRGSPAEQLEQLLEQPVTLTVANATVSDIVQMLRAALPVNVMLDAKSLEDLAYDRKETLSADSSGHLKLRQALDLLLSETLLDFICKDDTLLITAHFIAENHPITKIYEVADLLRPLGTEHEHETVDFDSLINLISASVLPPAFSNNNGQPRIFPIEQGDLLVIPHSRRGHEQITKLLTELRRGRGLKIPDTLKIAGQALNLAQQQESPPAAGTPKDPAADPDAKILRFEFTDEGLGAELVKKMKPAERLEYQLRRRALLQVQNVTIAEVGELLGSKLQVNVLVDRKALDEAAFETAFKIRYLPNAGTRLSSSLRQMLLELGLSFVVEEETLLITTRVAQENKQFLRYYAVGELIRPIGISPHLIQSDFDSLIQLIQSTIDPTTWKANGGQGDVAPQEALDLLLVSNTWQVQEQVEELIAQLRKIHAAKAETIQANEATLQRVVYQLVLPREEIKKEKVDNHGQVTEREILQGELQYSLDDLIETIKKTIEPASWTDDKHRIDALGNSLIVTHSQATQRKLHDLLHELGITQSQHQPLQQHGYQGGGFGGGGGGLGGGGGGGQRGGPWSPAVTPPAGSNPPANPNTPAQSGGIF